MITVISRQASPLNSLNSSFSSQAFSSLLSCLIPRSSIFNLFIYISIAESPSLLFRSNWNSLSFLLATAEANSRNPVRHSPVSRYLKPFDGHSTYKVLSHERILIACIIDILSIKHISFSFTEYVSSIIPTCLINYISFKCNASILSAINFLLHVKIMIIIYRLFINSK